MNRDTDYTDWHGFLDLMQRRGATGMRQHLSRTSAWHFSHPMGEGDTERRGRMRGDFH